MVNEKVIVILLLVTIILSMATMIVSWSANADDASQSNESFSIEQDQGSGQVSFELTTPGDTG